MLTIESLHGIEDGIHFNDGEFHTNCCAWACGVLETPHGDIVASEYDDADLHLNESQIEWLVDHGCTLDDEPVDHAQEVTLSDGRNLADALNEAAGEAESDLETAIHDAIAQYILNCVGLHDMLRYEPATDEWETWGYDGPEEGYAIEWANSEGFLSWDFAAKTITLDVDGEIQTEQFQIVAERDHLYASDFGHYDETLCRLNDGAMVVIGEGGAMSRWSQSCDGGSSRGGGNGIIVPTAEELADWDIED